MTTPAVVGGAPQTHSSGESVEARFLEKDVFGSRSSVLVRNGRIDKWCCFVKGKIGCQAI